MAIVVRIDVELAKRTMSVGEFAEQVRLNPANVSVLKSGRAKAVRFSTLEAMCQVFDCQAGDLPALPRTDLSVQIRSHRRKSGRRVRWSP